MWLRRIIVILEGKIISKCHWEIAITNIFFRFVLERILYTEAEALQQMTLQPDFDEKISKDISSTLDFFNLYLPSLLSSLGAFCMKSKK